MSNQPECFVIMPFGGNEPAGKFTSKMVYEHVIFPAFEKALGTQANLCRIDKVYVGRELKDEIIERLKSAEVVVADISGNNPNVAFELGFRYAQGKPFVCISNTPESAHFWGETFQIINYTEATAPDHIEKALEEAFRSARKESESEAALKKLVTVVVQANPFPNEFQDRIAAWRVTLMQDQVRKIQGRTWICEFRSKPVYMHHLIEGAAEKLRPGEGYLALTNMRFWLRRGEDVESALLQENIEKAKSGIYMKRVFVLSRKEWQRANRPSKGKEWQILKAHSDAIKEVQKVTGLGNRGFSVRVLIVENLDAAVAEYGAFALLCDANLIPRLAIIPEPSGDGEFKELKFVFSGGSGDDAREIRRYKKRFDQAFAKAIPLPELLEQEKRKAYRRRQRARRAGRQ